MAKFELIDEETWIEQVKLLDADTANIWLQTWSLDSEIRNVRVTASNEKVFIQYQRKQAPKGQKETELNG